MTLCTNGIPVLGLVLFAGLAIGAVASEGEQHKPQNDQSAESQYNQQVFEKGSQPNPADKLGMPDRERFLQIERIARLPAAQQDKEFPRLYRELAPGLMNGVVEGILSSHPADILDRGNHKFLSSDGDCNDIWAKQITEAATKLTPEELANKLEPNIYLNVAARALCIQILKKHPQLLKSLMREDLESATSSRVGRAAGVVYTLKLDEFLDTLLSIYLRNDDCSPAAWVAILWYPQPAPRIAKALIADVSRNPNAVIRHAGLLAGLQDGQKADLALVKLLDSPELPIRLAAASAVAECQDDSLAGPIARLAHDPDIETRITALRMARGLSEEAFSKLHDDLALLLKSPDTAVRVQGCVTFAARKGKSSAATLLDFLKQDRLSPGDAVHVMQSLVELTGTNFNYNMHEWGPAFKGNQESIDRFKLWIDNNAGDKHSAPTEHKDGIPTGPKIAVFNAASVIKRYERFEEQTKALKIKIKETESQLKEMQQEVAASATGQNLAERQEKLTKLINSKKQQIMFEEQTIYFDAMMSINKAVEKYSEQHGIQLVLRIDTDPVDPTKREDILRGINRPIYYFDASLDISEEILKVLNAE